MDGKIKSAAGRFKKNINRSLTTKPETENSNEYVELLVRFKDKSAPKPAYITVKREYNTCCKIKVKSEDLEKLRNDDLVERIEFEPVLKPKLDFAVKSVKHDVTKTEGFTGKGVIVAIIDSGIDITHKSFRKKSGNTRILSYWDQSNISVGGIETKVPDGFDYGFEIKKSDINRLNDRFKNRPDDAGRAITRWYDPTMPENPEDLDDYRFFFNSNHGTHVAGIAAGNGNAPGDHEGFAPNSDIIAVKYSIDRDEIRTPGKNPLQDSPKFLDALHYVFSIADKEGKPCVVNISLGINLGPKDGSGLAEMEMDYLISEKPGRAICIAAGNEGNDKFHSSLKGSGSFKIIKKSASSNSEFEVWSNKPVSIEVVNEDGDVVFTAAPNSDAEVKDQDGNRVGSYVNRKHDPSGRNFFNFYVWDFFPPYPQEEDKMPTGQYSINIDSGEHTDNEVHIFVDHFELIDGDSARSINSISCGKYVISVGARDGQSVKKGDMATFSSYGPAFSSYVESIDDVSQPWQKPEVTAPGTSILAAKSISTNSDLEESIRGSDIKSGTSMASPAIAGMIACYYEKNGFVEIEKLRTEMRQACLTPEHLGRGYWYKQGGFGDLISTRFLGLEDFDAQKVFNNDYPGDIDEFTIIRHPDDEEITFEVYRDRQNLIRWKATSSIFNRVIAISANTYYTEQEAREDAMVLSKIMEKN